MAVAQRVIVLYGGITLPRHDVEQFSKRSTEKNKRIVFSTDGEPSLIYVLQVVDLRSQYDDRVPISLFDAMQQTCTSLATVPRDKIFALLGLCYDATRLVPLPNYRQDTEDLLANLTFEFINQERSLDMICLGGSKSPGHGPSWVPNWLEMWSKERPKTSLQRAILQRRQSSSEVGQHQLRGSLQLQASRLLNVRGRCVGVNQSISTVLGDKHNDLSDVEFQGYTRLHNTRKILIQPMLS
jgi:hypothetical protein